VTLPIISIGAIVLLSPFMGEIEGGLSEEVRFSLAEIRDHFFREEFRRKMICGVK